MGLIELTKRSVILALLAGLSQYFQLKLALPSLPKPTPTDASQPPSLTTEFSKNMGKQMRYTLPIMITVFALGFPAAIALYWVTSNLFGIGHELLVKKQAEKLKLLASN